MISLEGAPIEGALSTVAIIVFAIVVVLAGVLFLYVGLKNKINEILYNLTRGKQ